MVDSVFEGGRRYRRLTQIFNVRGPALPCFLGISGSTFLARFEPDGPLVKSGLVSVDEDGDVSVIDRLRRLATVPGSGRLGAHELLLDAAPPGELEWSDFDHVAKARDHVEGLIRGALRAGAKGVNVLVHGESGTGKTEFCRTLARRLGVTLYVVGESDEEGDDRSTVPNGARQGAKFSARTHPGIAPCGLRARERCADRYVRTIRGQWLTT